MVNKREIFSYAASEATVHLGKDGRSLSIWFEVGRGIARVTLPLELARSLVDQVAFALAPSHPDNTLR